MKTQRLPMWLAAIVLGSSCGCSLASDGPAWDPSSVQGSLQGIEGAVQDIGSQLTQTKKRGRVSQDLGSDSDRMGLSMAVFMKATEGTPVRGDAEDLQKKFNELERLVASRAPLAKQQDAMKQVQDIVATIKSKL